MFREFSAHWRRRASATLLGASLVCCSLFVLGSPPAAAGEDWWSWRGPAHQGTSLETGLPTEWAADTNVAWRVALPDLSGSTPAVVGELVLLSVASDEDLELWAIERTRGEVVWKRPLGTGNYFKMKHNMSSPSPVSDGRSVWVMTGLGVVAAFDLAGSPQNADDSPRWRRDLQADYGSFGLNHGYGSSPLLDRGALYVQVLHGMRTDDASYVIALDAATGATRWRVERETDAVMESPDAYTTPLVWERSGRRELIVSGGDYVTGHDLATGRELWRVGGLNPDKAPMYRVVASPVAWQDMLFVPSRVKPLLGLRDYGAVGAPEGAGAPEVAFRLERGPDVPTPAVADGVLYVLGDRGLLSAYDARTGAVRFADLRLGAGTYSASPLVADGRLYATNEEGVTTVVSLRGAPEIVATNALEGRTLSSLAVAGRRLFLRTASALFCIGPARQ